MTIVVSGNDNSSKAFRRLMLENDLVSLMGPVANIQDFSDEDIREILRTYRPASLSLATLEDRE